MITRIRKGSGQKSQNGSQNGNRKQRNKERKSRRLRRQEGGDGQGLASSGLFGGDSDSNASESGHSGSQDSSDDDDETLFGLFGSGNGPVPPRPNAQKKPNPPKCKIKRKAGEMSVNKKDEMKFRSGRSQGKGGNVDKKGDVRAQLRNRASNASPYYWWGKAKLPQCPLLPPEPQEGNIEYKLQLVDVTPDKFQHLVTQCKWRLKEGNGTAFYRLGVEDDGNPLGLTDIHLEKSINTVKSVAARLRCDAKILKVAMGNKGKVALVQVRHFRDVDNCIDLRVCVCGEEGSGKSTLVGVLTSGDLDDGQGLARMNVFRHRHEIEDGRTSSASVKLLGYDQKGRITNYQEFGGEDANLVEVSDKVITLIDLGGHERYLKTTLANLTGRRPDYSAVLVAADTGVRDMTREHFGVIRALSIPSFVVLSKTDLANSIKVKASLNQLKMLAEESVPSGNQSGEQIPEVVFVDLKEKKLRENSENTADAEEKNGLGEEKETKEGEDLLNSITKKTADGTVIPVFPLSCTTGEGLHTLKRFLGKLPIRRDLKHSPGAPTEFAVSEFQKVDEVGLVMTGTVMQGVVRTGQRLMLGPLPTCDYKRVMVRSIHTKRTATKACAAGVMASLAISGIQEQQVRPGMVLLAPCVKRVAVMVFDAEIWPVAGSVIHPNCEIVIHMGAIRQAARLVSFESDGSDGARGLRVSSSTSAGSPTPADARGESNSNKASAKVSPIKLLDEASETDGKDEDDQNHASRPSMPTESTIKPTLQGGKQRTEMEDLDQRRPSEGKGRKGEGGEAQTQQRPFEPLQTEMPRGRTRARFQFIFRPEYVKVNSRFVFRERRTKGIGQVISVENETSEPLQAKTNVTRSRYLSKGILIRQSSGDTPLHSPVLEPSSAGSDIGDLSPFPISSLKDLEGMPGLNLPSELPEKPLNVEERVARIFPSPMNNLRGAFSKVEKEEQQRLDRE